MKILIVFLSAIAIAAAGSLYSTVFNEEWETYKVKFDKNYTSEEDKIRQKIFLDKKLEIAEHNQKYYEGKEDFYLGINQFSDMLPHELNNFKGYKKYPYHNVIDSIGGTFVPPHGVSYPKSIDWRDLGAVTRVKNQKKHCGSCWIFSATGSLEGQHFRKTGKLVSLSEQNVVDCFYLRDGCGGGLPEYVFTHVAITDGIDTEESYPYADGKQSCKFSNSTIGATDYGFNCVEKYSEDALLAAVATIGPISVCIDASSVKFHSYKGGVHYDPKCSTFVDHCVLVVGYGTEDGKDFWWVKNSWGPQWGLNGYIKMARNKYNNCGIASTACYPLV